MAEEPQTVPLISKASPSQIQKEEGLKQTQVSGFPNFPYHQNSDIQTFPVLYPALLPGLTPLQNQGQMNRDAGIYAVPTFPFMGPVTGLPYNSLVPFTYNTPTSTASSQRPTPDAGVVRAETGESGEEEQHQHQPQPPVAQRQVIVRRFHIAIQLDLFLILKLAAVIFLFYQDGSRQRLAVLVFFASLIYFYQTGALAPLIRWLSQGMRGAAVPPNPPRPAVGRENGPPVAGQAADNVIVAEREVGAENGPGSEGREAAENENAGENGGGNQLWGVVREIQMIVFGFITSLLPAKMAMRHFYNEIKGMRVKECPGYVKPMPSVGYAKKAVQKGLDNYHAKYVETSSIDPLYHVCFGGMIFSYLVALPEERRHLEHQQQAKEHGGH